MGFLDPVERIYNYLQRDKIIGKQKYEKHCTNLLTEFEVYLKNNSVLGAAEGWKWFFDRFYYKEEFLPHLYTGHEKLYQQLLPVLQSKQRDHKAEGRFKSVFHEFIKEARLETTPFGGICHKCKDFKNDKNLTKKLDSFTMPFGDTR